MAPAALLPEDAGWVLLVHATYKAHWDLPGAYVEPGESPLAACTREELSVSPTVCEHLVLNWAPVELSPPHPGGPGYPTNFLSIYDGSTLLRQLHYPGVPTIVDFTW